MQSRVKSFQFDVAFDSSPEEVMDAFWDLERWPQVAPHVQAIDIHYEDDSVQVLTMTVETRGRVHAFRSVRIRQESSIFFFQPRPPALLRSHWGWWHVSPSSDGGATVRSEHCLDPVVDEGERFLSSTGIATSSAEEVEERLVDLVRNNSRQTMLALKGRLERVNDGPAAEPKRRVLASLALLLAMALPSDGAVAAAEAPWQGRPDTVTRTEASIHQAKSTAERPYSVFEYEVPTTGAVPHILAINDADQVFFSESGGRFARNFIDQPAQNRVGRLDLDGTISEWSLSTEGSSPMGVVFDRQGDLWVTERLGNRVTRLRKDGGVDRYELPTAGAWPTGIAVDSRGGIWFSETKGDRIGRLDPQSGEIVEYPLPVRGAMPTGIAVDHRDRVWVAERDANTIGRFDPKSETFTQFVLPTPDSKPCALVVDRDGTLWFSERNGGKIGRIEEDGTIREFAIADRFSGPFFLVADRQGSIWFSELFAGRIGRFDPPTGTFEHFELPGENTYPAGIALDSKGNVWYAQQANDRIGVLVRTDLSYIADEEAKRQGGAAAPAPRRHEIVEHDVPTPQSIPGIVAVDRHDTVWFTEMGGGWVGPGFPPGPPGTHLGFIRDGEIGEIRTPTAEGGPTSLALDPCSSDVWFTLRAANRVARVRDDEIVEYEIPIADSEPIGIAVDLNHNVWVALSKANKLGRRSPDGEWRFLDVPEPEAEPRTIYVDPQNEVWFAEKSGNHVGRVDVEAWRLERWPIPTRMAWPLSLIADRDGNLWFAQMRSDKLAMLDRRTKRIEEYSLPVQSAPFKLLYDSVNGAMWISTVFYNAILRFDMTQRRVTEVYQVPSEGAWIGGLDQDSEGCIWFSEQFANKIGRLCIEGVAPPDRSSVFVVPAG